MGGGSSAPRSLTLEQEQGTGVVKVSEAVARRLVGKPELLDTPSPRPGDQSTQSLVRGAGSDQELGKLQARYEKRIRALEKQNKDLHETTTEQFARAVEEVEKKFLKTTAAPICDDLQNEVMRCYQDNGKETLHCSQLVKSFSTCVQQQRESILTKKDCQPCMLAQMARGPCGAHFVKAYDCYLEDREPEACADLYLKMKDCWDQHPEYGYDVIVDKAYKEPDPDSKKPAVTKDSKDKDNSNQQSSSSSQNVVDNMSVGKETDQRKQL